MGGKVSSKNPRGWVGEFGCVSIRTTRLTALRRPWANFHEGPPTTSSNGIAGNAFIPALVYIGHVLDDKSSSAVVDNRLGVVSNGLRKLPDNFRRRSARRFAFEGRFFPKLNRLTPDSLHLREFWSWWAKTSRTLNIPLAAVT